MTGAGFKDHFSSVAEAYVQARPEYPAALFDALAAHVPATAHVWEPGCGSGQATRGLAARFAHVHAADPSAQQIARHWAAPHDPGVPVEATAMDIDASGLDHAHVHAHGHPQGHAPLHAAASAHLPARGDEATRVSVAVEPGERTALADGSVQLVAVAQALHWFDREAFFAECARVLAPGGVLAAWGYGDFIAPEGMEDAVAAFRETIEPHWPPERVLVDGAYAGFDWPFPALPAPRLQLEADWSLPHLLAYLASMSAVDRCARATGQDPVALHAPALAQAWGDPLQARRIRWPLFLHLRRKAAS